MNTCLHIIDMQNDFCANGTLPVPGAESIIPTINQLYEYAIQHCWEVTCSKDDHPYNSHHFATYGGIWPEHCIHGTSGAELHPDLNMPLATIVVKGTKVDEDGFSAFTGHLVIGQSFGDYLKQKKVSTLVVVGVATEYCDLAFVLDALDQGYRVLVVIDAISAVNLHANDGQKALQTMWSAGAMLVSSDHFLGKE